MSSHLPETPRRTLKGSAVSGCQTGDFRRGQGTPVHRVAEHAPSRAVHRQAVQAATTLRHHGEREARVRLRGVPLAVRPSSVAQPAVRSPQHVTAPDAFLPHRQDWLQRGGVSLPRPVPARAQRPVQPSAARLHGHEQRERRHPDVVQGRFLPVAQQ